MRIYTAHIRSERLPVLLREGFCWSALAYGPLWLLAHRAWLPAILYVAIAVIAALTLPAPWGAAAGWLLVLLSGLLGRDLVRWSLARDGYAMAAAVAATDADYAFARFLAHRPDVQEWCK
jgi:hypothetical protein